MTRARKFTSFMYCESVTTGFLLVLTYLGTS